MACSVAFDEFQTDLGVDAVKAYDQTKDNRFAVGSTSTLARNAFDAKLGLIGYKFALKGRLSRTALGFMDTDTMVNGVGLGNRKRYQFNYFGNSQIHRKKTDNLSKLGFADFQTAVIPVSPNHFKQIAFV